MIYPVLVGFSFTNSAMAASAAYMTEDCKNAALVFFDYFQLRTEQKYEVQRADGTHAVNGTIHLETGSKNYQCSYNAKGTTLVHFFAEGKSWPGFARGEGSPHKAANSAAPTTASSDKKFAYRFTLKVKNERAPRNMGCDFSQRQGFVHLGTV